MTPTSFEFTLTLPSDVRLVGAVRGLTAHAAGYAHLDAATRDALADQVAASTEAAMAAAPGTGAPIALRFTGDGQVLVVLISFEGGRAPRTPAAPSGATVEWTTDGARHVCRIRQQLSS